MCSISKRLFKASLLKNWQKVDYVVIDGKSTDGTVDLLRKSIDEISCWISEADGSMYEALNKGLKAAKGDIVGIVNSDDARYDEYTVYDVVKAFAADPDVDGICGDQVKETSCDQQIKKVFQVDYYDYLVVEKGTFVRHGSLFVRHSVIDKIGGYDTSFRFASDYDLILRALQCGTLKYVPVPISRFRVHETSITSSGRLPVERDAILKRHAKNGRARLRAIWRRHLLLTRYRLFRVIYLAVWPLARARRTRLVRSRSGSE